MACSGFSSSVILTELLSECRRHRGQTVPMVTQGRKWWRCWAVMAWLSKSLDRDDDGPSEIKCQWSGEDMGEGPLAMVHGFTSRGQ